MLRIITAILFGLAMAEAGNAQPLSQITRPDSNVVFRFVEQMPAFDGDLNGWMGKNIRYPVTAKKADIEGRAAVTFIIRSDGSIDKPEIVRSSGNSALDSEALRLVRTMPRWKPGRQQGRPVNVNFTLPVTFRLP